MPETPRIVTLVHKGAMEIAVPSVASFARHFGGKCRLEIHTDGTPDAADEQRLLSAAVGVEARIVRPPARRLVLEKELGSYPQIRELLDGVGYNAKLELPMVVETPYFYFDSDIVWLRPVLGFVPENAPNAFSTESWTWYNGVSLDKEWVRAGIPRRVNSGFYYLTDKFPFARMEDMLTRGLFDPERKYNTDQEIMAYLFPSMVMYHPEDFKRSRRNHQYDLATDASVAIHFPGGMWRAHLEQMRILEAQAGRAPVKVRYQSPVGLTRAELWKMRLRVKISDSPILGRGVNLCRAVLRK